MWDFSVLTEGYLLHKPVDEVEEVNHNQDNLISD